MFVPCEEGKESNLNGFTLILNFWGVWYLIDTAMSLNLVITPAVAIGNVGQLAVDILIYNIPLKKIGYFYDSCILPIVGNDPFTNENEGNLVTSVEVYKSEEKKLVVVQQRAPIRKGCRQIYCDKMIEWIKCCQFKQTVLLSSCLASERLDSQIQSGPFRFVLSTCAKNLNEMFRNKFGWKSLEKRESSEEKANTANNDIFLPGGGVSKQFYQTCCKKDIPLAMLLVFCAEGDNIPDAMTLLHYINYWLHLIQDRKEEISKERQKIHWKEPPSWQNLYGTKRFFSLF